MPELLLFASPIMLIGRLVVTSATLVTKLPVNLSDALA